VLTSGCSFSTDPVINCMEPDRFSLVPTENSILGKNR
jgi:hypothetical protein